MQKIKTQKGITLVALIITIIVMLILVAVTLVITLGENGIIAKAREASLKSNDRQNAEKDEFSSENAENNINDLVNEGKTWNINTGDKASNTIKYGEPYILSLEDTEGYDFGGLAVILYDDGTVFMLDGFVNFDGSSDEFDTFTGTYTNSSKQIMLDELGSSLPTDERNFVNSLDGEVFKIDYDTYDIEKYIILYNNYELLTDGECIYSCDGASENVKAFIKTLAN